MASLGSRSTIARRISSSSSSQPRRRLLDHLPQLRVLAVLGQQLARALEVVLELAVLDRQPVGRLQLAVLAANLGVALSVPDHPGSDICPSSSAKRASICSTSESITPHNIVHGQPSVIQLTQHT